MYSSDDHSFALFLRNLVWESFIIICLSLDKAQGLIYDPGPLPLRQPTVEPLQYPTELDIVVAFFPLLHKSPICD